MCNQRADPIDLHRISIKRITFREDSMVISPLVLVSDQIAAFHQLSRFQNIQQRYSLGAIAVPQSHGETIK